MEPDLIKFDMFFNATAQVDTRDLTQLALFAGASGSSYADQTGSSFTFSRSGVIIDVSGEDFVYSGGAPVSGEVTGMVVRSGNATAYSFDRSFEDDTPVIPVTLFDSDDPLAIASDLFAGNDYVSGSNIADSLYGFDGDDMLYANSGNDLVYGEKGNDQLFGGNGDDKLYGGAGDDWLGGDKGDDKLYGGKGFDIASYAGHLAPVVVNLSKGKVVKAHVGANQVDKLKGIEGVLGGLGKDKITGNSSDNKLGGDAGDDILKGKGGSDVLVGGWGSDTLIGGKGADVFLFDKPPAGSSWADVDLIKDFGRGADTLQFDQMAFGELDAGVLSADHFYAAPGAFAGIGETYLVYDTKNGILYYDRSGDGSGPVFQVAVLKGAPSLSASDIFVKEYVPDLDV